LTQDACKLAKIKLRSLNIKGNLKLALIACSTRQTSTMQSYFRRIKLKTRKSRIYLDIWFELDKKYIFEAIIGQELGLYSVGGRTSARGKGLTRTSLGYREAATSKRICKYKAITKELKHARTKCNYKANAKCKTSNKSTDY